MTSTRSRSALVPLSQVVAKGPEDQEPAPGFVASLHGVRVEVTAVLQRTAVVVPLSDGWADKQVVRLTDLLVDPEAVRWRPKTFSTGFPAKRRRLYSPEQREAMRAATDRRAQADQARHAAAHTPASRAAAQPVARVARRDAGATTSRPVAAATTRPAVAVSTVSDDMATTLEAAEAQSPVRALAAELGRARQRIAVLEAELEGHRAAERRMLRRIARVVGRRAA